MAITTKQLEKLQKKFKNLDLKSLKTAENEVHVLAITYQVNGLPNKISDGLVEVNALWDERKSRPPGYIVAHSIQNANGVTISIMVTEEWYETNKLSDAIKAWNKELGEEQ